MALLLLDDLCRFQSDLLESMVTSERDPELDRPRLRSRSLVLCPSNMSRSAYNRSEGSDSAMLSGLGIEDGRGMVDGDGDRVQVRLL